MTRDDLATYLENAASSVLEATKGESAEIRAGALVAWGLLRVGAMLAKRGLDPVAHITRLLDIDGDMGAVEIEADAAADKKFAAPEPPPVVVPEDPPSPVDPAGSGTPTT